ncbi:hypothetical protein EI77_04292 [Prosthecobacter fusiformis]|uniref:Uncharacterized protein n=1 Tax=Prosthecobacter fusiformis TaxID=48464 RepID=A0A4R7RJ25_9BACT|nr:hypothetical protein [Prosthecobacter fusiformis]TDU64108.1 hypothetical protein EI77_04292 [Prosthecobacter fusiformis]
MNGLPRWLYFLPALIAIVWLGWWLFGRSPTTQILAAQQKFLIAVEGRDWKEVRSMLATDYADSYGLTQETAPATAAEIMQGFLFLTLRTEVQPFQPTADRAAVRVRIQMEGQGLGFSPMIISRVNAMPEPWHFIWRKDGPWHWSWKIIRIHQSDLPLPAASQ